MVHEFVSQWDESQERDDLEEFPCPDCLNLDEWDITMECVQHCVLWDTDWESEDAFLDAAPDEASASKRELGISKNYYTSIVPKPTESELTTLRTFLAEITG